MKPTDSLLTARESAHDQGNVSLRPSSLDAFIGQTQLKNNLKVFISSAKQRGAVLDHMLFYGPPGLGKTTLSRIIAQEMNAQFRQLSGPVINKVGDLAAILSNLSEGEILFIDEIHRLHISVEELLYPAMEDYELDLMVGDGPAARSVKIHLPKFTLIGATTRLGLLSNPLKDRFGIPLKLDFYDIAVLKSIIESDAALLQFRITDTAAEKIARCSRGTPRIAVRLVYRVRDFATHAGVDTINEEVVGHALAALGIDSLGLDELDRKYVNFILTHHNGGPTGIDTISAALYEDKDTLEDYVEPYLMTIGFLARTPRGRVLTKECLNHFGPNLADL